MELLRQKTDILLGEYRHLKQRIEEEKEALEKAKEYTAAAERAQEYTQKVAQSVQQQAHRQITPIVSHCLSAIFEDPYEFQILFEKKRGKTEARLLFKRGKLLLNPRMGSGGVRDLASLALRLSRLMLIQPPARKLVVLDEPFRDLSPLSRRVKARDLLLGLAQDLGVQVIMSTNRKGLETGKVIDLTEL